MEIEVLEYTGKKLKLKLIGEDHTFVNLLRKELWNDKDIKTAGYNVEHSLVTAPTFLLETNTKDAKVVLEDAIKRLKKLNEDIAGSFKKLE
ncbi:DNA-directed RNA polymerase subunit L [Candidatus Woesearchaeota archaeon]|nr:DNA-directed RNA polymerase subunit L [Candidatus Woesearchaeota archaeon]